MTAAGIDPAPAADRVVVATRSAAARWLGVLAAVGIAVFGRGLRIPYFGDDLLFVHLGPAPGVLAQFRQVDPWNRWYRPVEAVVLAAIQHRFGLETLPLHALALAAHIALAWIVWKALLDFGASRFAARLASLLMLVAQAGAAAVLGNDTLSEVFGTLFGTWALVLFARVLWPERAPGGRARVATWAAAGVALTLSLFSKEAMVGFALAALALAALRVACAPRLASAVRAAAIVAALTVAATALYLGMRQTASGPHATIGGSGNYGFHLGANVPEHLAMLAGTALLPVSTVAAFDAYAARSWVALGAIALLTLTLAAIVVVSLGRSGRDRATAFAALGLCTLAPVLPLRHVSELYAYSALPFVSAIVGVGLAEAIGRVRAVAARRAALVAVVAVLLVQSAGVISKAALMDGNGRASDRMLAVIDGVVPSIPAGGTLWLVRSDRSAPEYSIYRVEGVNVLRHAEDYIRDRTRRPDLHVEIIRASDLAARPPRDDERALVARGDRLEPWIRPPARSAGP